MKNEIQDEKFDQLMEKLMSDAALDDSAISDIADSPTLWWSVQRKINEQKTAASPWPPAKPNLRWLAIAVPAAAVLLIAAFVFVDQRSERVDLATLPVSPTAADEQLAAIDRQQPIRRSEAPLQDPARFAENKSIPVKTRPSNRSLQSKVDSATVVKSSRRTEIKTDFIALSYAGDAESGQVVRVKVPSSMMVSVGLVASVKKPTELIDAEVIVGDDGLTRAIRFIHIQQ